MKACLGANCLAPTAQQSALQYLVHVLGLLSVKAIGLGG